MAVGGGSCEDKTQTKWPQHRPQTYSTGAQPVNNYVGRAERQKYARPLRSGDRPSGDRWSGARRFEDQREPAGAAPYRQPERRLETGVGERFAKRLAGHDGQIVDLQDDVAGLEASSIGRALRHDRRNGQGGRRAGLGISHDETELGPDSLPDDR